MRRLGGPRQLGVGQFRGVGGGGAAPAAWTPASLTSLRGWYRADSEITLIGADVGTWADLSGNSNDLTSPGGGQRPLWVATGFNGGSQPYVEGDGVAEYVRKVAFSYGGDPDGGNSVFIVYQDVTVTGRVWGYDNSPIEADIRQTAGGPMWVLHFDSVAATGAAMSTARSVIGTRSAAGLLTQYVSGVSNGTPAASAIAQADGATMSLFATPMGTALANVRIAEIAVTRATVTAPEIVAFTAYAAARYGVPA